MRQDGACWVILVFHGLLIWQRLEPRRSVNGVDGGVNRYEAEEVVGGKEGIKTEPILRHLLSMLDQLEGDDVTKWLKMQRET